MFKVEHDNAVKYDEDFRFQLTREEIKQLSRSKKLTTIQTKCTHICKNSTKKYLIEIFNSGFHIKSRS